MGSTQIAVMILVYHKTSVSQTYAHYKMDRVDLYSNQGDRAAQEVLS